MSKRFLSIVTIIGWGLLLLACAPEQVAPAAEAPAGPPLLEQCGTVEPAITWLVGTHQNDDGGFSDFSAGANLAPSGVAGTLDAVQALVAAGFDPAAGSGSPVAFLQSQADEVAAFAAGGGGQAGKAILALTAAGQNPRDFGGHDLVSSLTDQLLPTGEYSVMTAYDQAVALLALAAVGERAPESAIAWLKNQQAENGSWDDGFGTADNVDATGMAIMALTEQGEPLSSDTLVSARDFLAAVRLPGGAWEYGAGFGANPNSTALAVQALSALGEDFYSAGGAWDLEGTTPLAALLQFQSETGAFQADFGEGPFDDFFATVQAVPAVVGMPFPLPAPSEAMPGCQVES